MPAVGFANRAPQSRPASLRTNWRRAPLPWAERLPTRPTLTRFLAEAQEEVGLRGQVTVLLTTDATICDLNLRFRGQDKPTDVLSFRSADLLQNQEGAEKIAGDVAISVETARRQAAEQGHALTCELKILLLHGLLHLAGYDHEADQGRMEQRERVLRARLRLPLGLIERARSESASQRAGKAARSSKP